MSGEWISYQTNYQLPDLYNISLLDSQKKQVALTIQWSGILWRSSGDSWNRSGSRIPCSPAPLYTACGWNSKSSGNCSPSSVWDRCQLLLLYSWLCTSPVLDQPGAWSLSCRLHWPLLKIYFDHEDSLINPRMCLTGLSSVKLCSSCSFPGWWISKAEVIPGTSQDHLLYSLLRSHHNPEGSNIRLHSNYTRGILKSK